MEEIFELVCQECSKTFESTDVNATICSDCWEKFIEVELKNEGA